MSDIKTRKFKCTGCGEDRPCYLETNRESSIMDVYTEDTLTCVLDATNRTGFNWEEVVANEDSDNHEQALPINSVSTSFLCDVCGEEKTGEKHKMYDENWNFEGCYECADCFNEKMRGQIGEH